MHVEDILAATARCLESGDGFASLRINAAGHHFTLSELVQHCKHPAVPDGPDFDLSSKVVSSEALLDQVMPEGFDFISPLPDRAD